MLNNETLLLISVFKIFSKLLLINIFNANFICLLIVLLLIQFFKQCKILVQEQNQLRTITKNY